MNADIAYILSMSCVLPALIGVYRLRGIDKKFHSFIYMMILVVLLETLIFLGFKYPVLGRLSRLPVNVYMLLNLYLFLRFVHANGYLLKKNMQALLGIAVLVAVCDYFHNISVLNLFLYLLCFVSVVMLIISIDILSKQMIEIRYKLANNFWFWFSAASVLYNAINFLIFGVLVFSLWDTEDGKSVAALQHIINAVSYLLFALAILKIPKKDK